MVSHFSMFLLALFHDVTIWWNLKPVLPHCLNQNVDFRLFALVIWSVIYNQWVIAHVHVSYIHVACFHTYAVNNSFSAEVDD